MAYVLESSSLVGAEGFSKVKELVKVIIQYFNVRTVKTAVVEVANTAVVRVPFNQFNDQNAIFTELDRMKSNADRTTKLSSGLQTAYLQLLKMNTNSKFIVLVTATHTYDAAEQRQLISIKESLRGNGIQVIVLAVGDTANAGALRNLASAGKFYLADDFDDIVGFIENIRGNLCQKA